MWGFEREERVQFRNTEQEEDRGDESKHTGGDRARDDSSTSNDAVVAKKIKIRRGTGESIRNSLCIFRLFGDVARRIKASDRARGEKAAEYPHQASRMDSRAIPTTHNDRSQFHPPGAPVPLSFICYQ